MAYQSKNLEKPSPVKNAELKMDTNPLKGRKENDLIKKDLLLEWEND